MVATRRRRDPYRSWLRKVLSEADIEELEKLSADTGISLRQVHQDSVKEGTATLRVDGYESLITFRKRIGKVVHERDIIEGSGEFSNPISNGAAAEENESPGIALSDPQDVPASTSGYSEGSGDVIEPGRRRPESRETSGLSFDEGGVTPAPGQLPEGIDSDLFI